MTITCIACNRSKHQVPKLIQITDTSYICNECTSEINALFAQDAQDAQSVSVKNKRQKWTPKYINSLLDDYVIGQRDAKKVLSVEIYNHYKRINNLDKEIKKSNILLIGDSGTGKTLLVETLSKILDLPLVIADMSLITASGYVGQDIESTLQQLVIAANGDIAKAETGIVLLDEVDKIAKRNLTSSAEKDPSGEGVQQGLLKILEGSDVRIKVDGGSKQNRSSEQYINTSNILFICAGAFFGLDKVLEKNHASESAGIGFSADVTKPDVSNKEIDEQDIIEYGFIPEFVGRLPVVVKLNKLTKDDYRRILVEPKNSVIRQYQQLMEIDGYSLEFTAEYLDSVVDAVYNTKRGARALRTIIERRMRDVVYDLSFDEKDKSIVIDIEE
jgi:ATP-dependent Clp protease ATP-binding subunit ClpX